MTDKTSAATAAAAPAPAVPGVAAQDTARTEPAGGRKRAGLHSVKPGETFQVVDGNNRVVHAGEVTRDGAVALVVKDYQDLAAPFHFDQTQVRGLVGDGHTVTVTG